MAISTPTLDVFYIDLNGKNSADGKLSKFSKGLATVGLLATGPIGIVAALAANAGASALERFVKENRFFVIETSAELAKYENALGNEWVTNQKALKQKQYYIRHPKKSQQNILIEANDFYSYIEEEQKDELIEFIMAHCPAKVIQIDRAECIEVGGNAKGNVQGADLSGGANYGKMRGNYFSLVNPNGVPRVKARENYFWIDKSIMRSIASLTEGASITQSYQSDFTFGLNLSEAKTIGLDMSMHKKFSYTIHIEC